MRSLLIAGAVLCGATTAAVAASSYDVLPGQDVLPEGVVQVSPLVPGMGEHWANPADLPLGPIYCVHRARSSASSS